MSLSEITRSARQFYERNGFQANAILLDINCSTELCDLMDQMATVKDRRQPGAKFNTVMGMRVIQSDVKGFILAFV